MPNSIFTEKNSSPANRIKVKQENPTAFFVTDHELSRILNELEIASVAIQSIRKERSLWL